MRERREKEKVLKLKLSWVQQEICFIKASRKWGCYSLFFRNLFLSFNEFNNLLTGLLVKTVQVLLFRKCLQQKRLN